MGIFNKKEAAPTIKKPKVDVVAVRLAFKEGPYYLQEKNFGTESIELLNKNGDGITFVPKPFGTNHKKVVDISHSLFGNEIAENQVEVLVIENDTDFPIPNVVFSFKDTDSNEKQTIVYSADENVVAYTYLVNNHKQDTEYLSETVLLIENDVDYSGYNVFNFNE